jgi:hypothetical protein
MTLPTCTPIQVDAASSGRSRLASAGPRGAFYGVRGAGEFGEKAILYQLEGAAAMARSPA